MLREDVLERLVAANITILPITVGPRHVVFERDGFVALVERRGEALGAIGSAGMLTEKGFATLVSKDGRQSFVARDFSQPATEDQVQGLRSFQNDLEAALR
jgi:hypothetical protein